MNSTLEYIVRGVVEEMAVAAAIQLDCEYKVMVQPSCNGTCLVSDIVHPGYYCDEAVRAINKAQLGNDLPSRAFNKFRVGNFKNRTRREKTRILVLALLEGAGFGFTTLESIKRHIVRTNRHRLVSTLTAFEKIKKSAPFSLVATVAGFLGKGLGAIAGFISVLFIYVGASLIPIFAFFGAIELLGSIPVAVICGAVLVMLALSKK